MWVMMIAIGILGLLVVGCMGPHYIIRPQAGAQTQILLLGSEGSYQMTFPRCPPPETMAPAEPH